MSWYDACTPLLLYLLGRRFPRREADRRVRALGGWDDVVQTGRMVLWRCALVAARGGIDPEKGCFTTYFGRALAHKINNLLAARELHVWRRSIPILSRGKDEGYPHLGILEPPDPHATDPEMAALAADLLEQLPERFRDLCRRCWQGEASQADLARELGRSREWLSGVVAGMKSRCGGPEQMSPMMARVLDLVRTRGPQSARSAAAVLGIDARNVSHCLQRLHNLWGLLKTVGSRQETVSGYARVYASTDA
jgi:RNA polymerase sigma factor (sigma-70 family)